MEEKKTFTKIFSPKKDLPYLINLVAKDPRMCNADYIKKYSDE